MSTLKRLDLDKLSHKMKEGRGFIKFSMNIPRDIHREFVIKTTMDEIDMKDVLMKAIYEYLRKDSST